MSILDRLYMPTTKDVGSGNSNVRRWWKIISATPAAATVIQFTDPELGPVDTVRLIQTIAFNWGPGAGQTPINAFLHIVVNATIVQLVATGPKAPIAAASQFETITDCNMLWMQGEQLAIQGLFSAGGVNNNIAAYLTGLEFPRGTIQR